MATFYVTKDVGASDSNGGTNATNDAWATLSYAVANMGAGNTLIVGNGTWTCNGDLDGMPSGTSSSAMTIIRAESDEGAILNNTSGTHCIAFHNNKQWVSVEDFDIDGTNNANGSNILVRYKTCTNCRVKGGKIHNSKRSGVQTSSGGTVSSDCTLEDVEVYSNGSTDFDHGIYVAGSHRTKIRDCNFHDNAGWGIHHFGNISDDCIYERNKVWQNGRLNSSGVPTSTRAEGIVVSNGSDNVVRNNLVYLNPGAGIRLYTNGGSVYPAGALIYHNTSHENSGYGILCDNWDSVTNHTLANNICLDNTAGQIQNTTGATETTNLTSGTDTDIFEDPNNTTPASRDYQLKATASTAIDSGTSVGVSDDLLQAVRPQGSAPDIGCYEYASAPPDVPSISFTQNPKEIDSQEVWESCGVSVTDDDATDSDTVTMNIDSAGSASLRLTSTTNVLVDI